MTQRLPVQAGDAQSPSGWRTTVCTWPGERAARGIWGMWVKQAGPPTTEAFKGGEGASSRVVRAGRGGIQGGEPTGMGERVSREGTGVVSVKGQSH